MIITTGKNVWHGEHWCVHVCKQFILFLLFIERGVQELHRFCSISDIIFISDHLHSSLMGCRVELMALWICFQSETMNDLGSLYSIFVFSEDPYWVLPTHVLPIPFIYLLYISLNEYQQCLFFQEISFNVPFLKWNKLWISTWKPEKVEASML